MAQINKSTGLLADSSSVLFFSGVNFVIRLATTIIIARTLGVSGKGAYTLILTSAAFLGLFSNLGIGSSLTYFTASNKYHRNILAGFSIISSLIFSLLAGLIFYLLYHFLFSSSLLKGLSSEFLIIILLSLPWNLVTSALRSIYLGEHRIGLFNAINTSQSVIGLILLILSSLFSLGISGAIGAWFISQVISTAFALMLGKFRMDFSISDVLRLATEAISFGIKSYLANLSAFFNYRLDMYLVNFIAGTASVGLYTTSVNVAELIWFLPGAVSTALFPKVASMDPQIARHLTAMATRQVVMVTGLAAILLGFSGSFLIPFVYGAQFEPSVTPFLALLPGVVFLSAGKIISADLIGRGKPQYATYSSSLAMLSTITLDLVLIPKWGVTGAAVASSCAYFLSTMLISYSFCKETHASITELYLIRLSDISVLFERGVNILKRQARNIKKFSISAATNHIDLASRAPEAQGTLQLRMRFDLISQAIPTSPDLPDGYRLDTYKSQYLEAWRGLINSSREFGKMNLDYFLRTIVAGNIPDGSAFAFCGDELVACVSVNQLPEHSPDAVLMYLCVDPTHRGKRLGEILTHMVMREAKKQGFPGIILHTDDHRLAAIQIYLKIGFSPQLTDSAQENIRWQNIQQRLKLKRS